MAVARPHHLTESGGGMAQSGDFTLSSAMLDFVTQRQKVMQSTLQTNSLIRFGVFEADVRSGELRKNGIKIKIQDLPFRALKVLLSRPNEVISREEFRQALWPEDVFVDFDHGISSAINRVRDALGDSAENPVFIETVERRGYRWVAPTHIPAPAYIPMPLTQAPVVVQVQAPVQPASVTVRPQPESLAATGQGTLWVAERVGWMLVLPMIALVLAAWSFQPFFRGAKAAPRKSAAVTSKTDAARRAASSEAEQFYLKGRFYWEKRTPDGLDKAVDAFTQAIVRDANYAPAYVGLADCYNLLREYTIMPASEAYPRALAAARKAVALDDQSSEAHASLAFALFYGNWDTANAEREFRRAIELDPNNAVAHHWYATFLTAIDRHSESLAEIEQAQKLDPASKAIVADKGDLLWAAGRREEGLAILKQLEATEPDFVSPHRYLKGAYYAAGDYAKSLDEWKKEAQLLRDNTSLKLVDAAEKGYLSGGAQGMLQNELALQQRLYERGVLSPYALAETNSLLGNKREALRYLEIAYEKHDDSTIQMETDPDFNILHNDPAYKSLVARLGIPAQN
jgi:DNA-binding winged helix-turn-helix (wHTH) protein/Tfp pilus assembly protein PilF